MWHSLLDVGAIRAGEVGDRNLRVVDHQLEPAAEQSFGERDHRTLAQVVGPRLECEAEKAHATRA